MREAGYNKDPSPQWDGKAEVGRANSWGDSNCEEIDGRGGGGRLEVPIVVGL